MRENAAMGQINEAALVTYIINGIAKNDNERIFFGTAQAMAELRVLINRHLEILIPFQYQQQNRQINCLPIDNQQKYFNSSPIYTILLATA